MFLLRRPASAPVIGVGYAPRVATSAFRVAYFVLPVPARAGHVGAKRSGKPTGGSRPKRAGRGLYGGKVIQSGNNVSFSINRNRRTWKPNVHRQSLFSELLGCKLSMRVTTNVLRTIDKVGGLDNYLLRTSDKKLDSEMAVETKRLLGAQIMASQQKQLPSSTGVKHPPRNDAQRWTEAEEHRLRQLCASRTIPQGNTGWLYKALALGTDRSAKAVRIRWRMHASPRAQEERAQKQALKRLRSEDRIAMVMERAECTRHLALTALRRCGNPEARWRSKPFDDRLALRAAHLVE